MGLRSKWTTQFSENKRTHAPPFAWNFLPSLYIELIPNPYPSFRSPFYIFPRWRTCSGFFPPGNLFGQTGEWESPTSTGRCWGSWWWVWLVLCRPTEVAGTWSWCCKTAWLLVSGTLLALISSTFMVWINWAMPGAHVTVALGDSTCRVQVWVLAIHLQTISPKSWRICLMQRLRYARYERLAFHEWTWFLLWALVLIWVVASLS